MSKKSPHQVSVRETTYEKLREIARKNGEHVSTTLDAIITRYLDERSKLS